MPSAADFHAGQALAAHESFNESHRPAKVGGELADVQIVGFNEVLCDGWRFHWLDELVVHG
ncbi:MAG: hypothetical protein CFE26_08705 [Verrucomicrobiales bacterium VVV1]|nr:MAG: hypothetical protein CFE26_08705 [Verrucomicrobiales bacterium VVV1]